MLPCQINQGVVEVNVVVSDNHQLAAKVIVCILEKMFVCRLFLYVMGRHFAFRIYKIQGRIVFFS